MDGDRDSVIKTEFNQATARRYTRSRSPKCKRYNSPQLSFRSVGSPQSPPGGYGRSLGARLGGRVSPSGDSPRRKRLVIETLPSPVERGGDRVVVETSGYPPRSISPCRPDRRIPDGQSRPLRSPSLENIDSPSSSVEHRRSRSMSRGHSRQDITPVKGKRKKISPPIYYKQNSSFSSDKRQNASPPRFHPRNVSPPRECTRNVSPRKEYTRNVSPRREYRRSESPTTEFRQNMSRHRDGSQNLSNTRNSSQNLSNTRECRHNLSPPGYFKQNVSSFEDLRENVSPPRKMSRRVSPQRQYSKNVSPSRSYRQIVSPIREDGHNISSSRYNRKNISPPRIKRPNVSPRCHRQNVSPTRDYRRNLSPRSHRQNVSPPRDYRQNVSPRRDYRQIVSPTRDYRQNVSPPRDYRQNVSPIRDYRQNVSPIRDYRQNVSPIRAYRQSVSPPRDYRQNVSPTRNYRQSVSPSIEYRQNVPPLRENRQNSAPFRDYKQNAFPIRDCRQNTSPPPRDYRQHISPTKGYRQRISPVRGSTPERYRRRHSPPRDYRQHNSPQIEHRRNFSPPRGNRNDVSPAKDSRNNVSPPRGNNRDISRPERIRQKEKDLHQPPSNEVMPTKTGSRSSKVFPADAPTSSRLLDRDKSPIPLRDSLQSPTMSEMRTLNCRDQLSTVFKPSPTVDRLALLSRREPICSANKTSRLHNSAAMEATITRPLSTLGKKGKSPPRPIHSHRYFTKQDVDLRVISSSQGGEKVVSHRSVSQETGADMSFRGKSAASIDSSRKCTASPAASTHSGKSKRSVNTGDQRADKKTVEIGHSKGESTSRVPSRKSSVDTLDNVHGEKPRNKATGKRKRRKRRGHASPRRSSPVRPVCKVLPEPNFHVLEAKKGFDMEKSASHLCGPGERVQDREAVSSTQGSTHNEIKAGCTGKRSDKPAWKSLVVYYYENLRQSGGTPDDACLLMETWGIAGLDTTSLHNLVEASGVSTGKDLEKVLVGTLGSANPSQLPQSCNLTQLITMTVSYFLLERPELFRPKPPSTHDSVMTTDEPIFGRRLPNNDSVKTEKRSEDGGLSQFHKFLEGKFSCLRNFGYSDDNIKDLVKSGKDILSKTGWVLPGLRQLFASAGKDGFLKRLTADLSQLRDSFPEGMSHISLAHLVTEFHMET